MRESQSDREFDLPGFEREEILTERHLTDTAPDDRGRSSDPPDGEADPPSSDESSSEGWGGGSGRGSTAEATSEWFDADRLFSLLSNRRRRITLHFLRDEGGVAPFDAIVDAVATHGSDGPPDHHEQRAIASALYHVHLPKLADAGLVDEFDPDGTVRLSDRIAGVPWSLVEVE